MPARLSLFTHTAMFTRTIAWCTQTFKVEAVEGAAMNATLTRTKTGDSGTFGNLRLDDGSLFVTGELPWRDNAPQKSCIPAGTYTCAIYQSPEHGPVYQVQARSRALVYRDPFGQLVRRPRQGLPRRDARLHRRRNAAVVDDAAGRQQAAGRHRWKCDGCAAVHGGAGRATVRTHNRGGLLVIYPIVIILLVLLLVGALPTHPWGVDVGLWSLGRVGARGGRPGGPAADGATVNATFSSLAGAVASFAPTLASMLGGPLAGTAVSALEGAFGLKPGAGPDAVTDAMKAGGMTPEIAASVRAADQAYELKLKEADFDLAKLNADSAAALDAGIVSDVADARKANAGNETVMAVGIFILGSFLVAMCLVLWGCWTLITSKIVIDAAQAGMFAAVTGLVGAIVGYFASNAQTVVNFLFGGSLGGRKNADSLGDSVKQLGQSLGKAANNTP